MNKSIFLIFAVSVFLLFFSGCVTKELTPEEKAAIVKINALLPFQVSVNGNEARTDTEVAAVIDDPVPATAEIVCNTENRDLITITFMPCNKEGIVVPGKKPALIILRDSNKTTLDNTTDGKKLKPGFYLMDVTAGDKTSRIVIKIK